MDGWMDGKVSVILQNQVGTLVTLFFKKRKCSQLLWNMIERWTLCAKKCCRCVLVLLWQCLRVVFCLSFTFFSTQGSQKASELGASAVSPMLSLLHHLQRPPLILHYMGTHGPIMTVVLNSTFFFNKKNFKIQLCLEDASFETCHMSMTTLTLQFIEIDDTVTSPQSIHKTGCRTEDRK